MRNLLAIALLAQTACMEMDTQAFDEDDLGTLSQAGGNWVPTNGTPSGAISGNYLKRAKTDLYGITSPGESKPMKICSSVVPGYCEVPAEWDQWQNATAPTEKSYLLGALIYCALPPDIEVRVPGTNNGGAGDDWKGSVSDRWRGKMGMAPGWKTNRLTATEQERLSACVYALINADGQHVSIQINAPFGNGGTGPELYDEATFFGNLFLPYPTELVCGGENNATGAIVPGRLYRHCGEPGNACAIHHLGKCRGTYDPALANTGLGGGYCKNWDSANGYCVAARDDGSYTYNNPVTVRLHGTPREITGPLRRCGFYGDQLCEP